MNIYDLGFSIYDLAGRRGAAPRPLGFGGPAARLVRDLFERASLVAQAIINRKSEIENEVVRLPGIAPGHAPWREAILLFNHNRIKTRR